MTIATDVLNTRTTATRTMRAAVFHAPGDLRVEEVPRPRPGPGEAVIRITLTTICGTDVHILKGEYPVRPGLVVGHEPVGVIEELGASVTGYAVGERVLVGASAALAAGLACYLVSPLDRTGGSPVDRWVRSLTDLLDAPGAETVARRAPRRVRQRGRAARTPTSRAP